MQLFQLLHEGLERSYFVHKPVGASDADGALPLVLACHGGGGKAKFMDRLTNLNKVADEHRFLVVYPDGYEKHWNDGRGAPGHHRFDDVSFIDAVFEQVQDRYRVDAGRVYACGISNGGFFSQYLALQRPRMLAAFASVGATAGLPIVEHFLAPPAVACIFILGKEDPIIRWSGGEIKIGALRRGVVTSAEQAVSYWCKANDCTRVLEPYAVSSGEDETSVIRHQYAIEDENAVRVVLDEVVGGGHTWPGGWQYLPERMIGKTSQAYEASEAIWQFFNGYRRSR